MHNELAFLLTVHRLPRNHLKPNNNNDNNSNNNNNNTDTSDKYLAHCFGIERKLHSIIRLNLLFLRWYSLFVWIPHRIFIFIARFNLDGKKRFCTKMLAIFVVHRLIHAQCSHARARAFTRSSAQEIIWKRSKSKTKRNETKTETFCYIHEQTMSFSLHHRTELPEPDAHAYSSPPNASASSSHNHFKPNQIE